MPDKVDQYRALQAKAERAQREADRAAGAYDQYLQRLQAEFGADSPKAAKKLLTELMAQADADEAAYRAALEQFGKDWGAVLDEFGE